MKKLYPMTAEERALAETHIDLVGRYLRRHRLPEADYFDVVIFGYLEAVQTFFRKPIEEERANFPALARTCMKYSVYDHWTRENAQKRRGETLSLDWIASSSEDDDFSLYEVLFDERQDNPKKHLSKYEELSPEVKLYIIENHAGMSHQLLTDQVNALFGTSYSIRVLVFPICRRA